MLTPTLITSGYAILTTMSGPTLRFRATTSMLLRHSYQWYYGSLNVIEAPLQLFLKRQLSACTRLKTK